MTVTSVTKDAEALRMTITSEIDAPVDRAWELWSDPRQLERWWGPPTYPATFVEHDLNPGGTASYFMTGPEGDQPKGWWRVLSVDPPNRLEFEDGFVDEAGDPNPDLPITKTQVDLQPHSDGRTIMTIETRFPSIEAMEQMVAMGMVEGMTEALNQIDDIVTVGSTS